MAKYTLSQADELRLANSYTYHAPKDDQGARYELLRQAGYELARTIMENCPDSRERSVALTQLDTVVIMCANASIARNE